jgi:pSer/pThr/pTyr-binding forkhead associated (FHA) protein
VGSDAEVANVAVEDPTVSHVHAILERVGPIWVIRDLGSRNGTKINNERLVQQRRLRHRDEIFVGRTRLVFLDAASARRPDTEGLAPPPENITRGEKRVLVELCRPALTVAPFTPPASRREIAARLCVGQQAVQAHLTRLYDKFGIGAEESNRRVALANEAIQRGAVTLADLEAEDRDDERGT